MQIHKDILKAWEDIVQKQGITVVAKGAKVNYRTLSSALKHGSCTKKPYARINAFIAKENKKEKRIIESLDQD